MIFRLLPRRGVLPLFGQHIPAIVDARQRHLAPGGRLIPQRDTLWVALVQARAVYKEVVGPWDAPYGLSMEPAKEIALNRWETDRTDTIRSGHLLSEPYRWAVLDYASIQSPDVEADISLPVTRNGIAHGWLVWFDAQLTDGIGFSNGPEQTKFAEVYCRAFFPLLEPAPIVEGDTARLAIEAKLVGEEYIWSWASHIYSQNSSEKAKAEFRQSTAFGGLLDDQNLAQ